ncbi:hypothetical protein GCM10010977_32180 [Citricoccus zhacaiensis]|uniref:Thiamine-binding protein domain-containing protein n=2 Tax=Citricoccus TaxID=169133 RepID=A0ABV6F9K1_9MICC|nr:MULTISPECIES: hypothetical protein [Citricoccus]GGO49692.1 hypothetical protein GCM10010977_32180 [Citricoccus zhacaiensis]
MAEQYKRVTLQIPSDDVENSITPEAYMRRFWQILDALNIPATLDGTHVRYGDMSEAEGELTAEILKVVDARFPIVECNDQGVTGS